MSKSLMHDLQAGFSVFLLALPLCLGIAMASNFPPVAGIITAVVGGILCTFTGSARLTIKGPAAGLIVIVLGAVQELGNGDVVVGYHRALATIAVAAVLQIAFSLFRVGKLGEIMPPSVVHGMLAAIGVIIIAKQSHILMGLKPVATSPLGLLAELPDSIMNLNPEVFLIGMISILVVSMWPRIALGRVKQIPATLVILLIAIPASLYFHFNEAHVYTLLGHRYEVGPQFLIDLPPSLLSALTFPDFSGITDSVSLKYVIMFALVGSIESILTVLAVDGIDPEKRSSDLNRDLLATGIGNLVASLCGGLPMISEIVRSKANIDYGARTRYSNFFHGLFLLISIALLPELLEKIPLSALAALLVFTGMRLASPYEFRKIYRIGSDQFLLFFTTLAVTLLTDLLVGIGAGLLIKVLLHLYRGVRPAEFLKLDYERNQQILFVRGSLVFTNFLQLKRLIEAELSQNRALTVDLSQCHFIDHTIMTKLSALSGTLPEDRLRICGLSGHECLSEHPHAARRLSGRMHAGNK